MLPVVMRLDAHESRSLHGQVDVLQGEVERVGEGNGHKHLLLHLRLAVHLQTEKKKNNNVNQEG